MMRSSSNTPYLHYDYGDYGKPPTITILEYCTCYLRLKYMCAIKILITRQAYLPAAAAITG